MHAAPQGGRVEADMREHPLHGLDMTGLASVGGAGHCELLVSQIVGRSRLHHRQRLQRLDRRAREDRTLDIADCHDGAAIRVDDGSGAAVAAFH
jgi:hypothetical protein